MCGVCGWVCSVVCVGWVVCVFSFFFVDVAAITDVCVFVCVFVCVCVCGCVCVCVLLCVCE